MIDIRLAALFLLTACTVDNPGQESQLTNPASAFCIDEMRGRLEMVTDADGTRGICHLPEATSIDEWDLYHRHRG